MITLCGLATDRSRCAEVFNTGSDRGGPTRGQFFAQRICLKVMQLLAEQMLPVSMKRNSSPSTGLLLK